MELPEGFIAIVVSLVAAIFVGLLVNYVSASREKKTRIPLGVISGFLALIFALAWVQAKFTPVPNSKTAGEAATAAPTSNLANKDLGLPQRVAVLPCDNKYITIVKNAINPATYASDVNAALALHADSSYMITAGGCDSLRQTSSMGTLIYSVYLGPFSDLKTACAERDKASKKTVNKAYVKKLTSGLDPLESIGCP